MLLHDRRPDEEIEFINFDSASSGTQATGIVREVSGDTSQLHNEDFWIAVDDRAPDADAPDSFEVCNFTFSNERCH